MKMSRNILMSVRKPTSFSLVLVVILSLCHIFSKPGYAADEPVFGEGFIESQRHSVSEESWLKQQIRHFRSYPHLDRAYRLIESENYSKALGELERYLAIDSQDVGARLSYVIVLYKLKEYESVINATNTLLEEQPDNYEALKYQAYAYQHLNRLEEAVSAINMIEKSGPMSMENHQFALNMSVDIFLGQEKYEEASGELEQYLARYPQDVAAHLSYVIVLYKQKKYREVINAVNTLLVNQPDSYEALKYQAYAYQHLNRINEAVSVLEMISTHQQANQSDRQFSLNMIVDLLVSQKRYVKALSVHHQITESTVNFKYYYRLGVLYYELKQLNEATSAYVQAYQLAAENQDKFSVLMALGEIAKKRKSRQEAENYFISAASLAPKNRRAIREVANLAYQQKKYGKAVHWIRKALSGKEDRADREFLAHALYSQKQYPSAIQEYTKLLEKIKNRETLYRVRMGLGYAYFHIGKMNQAEHAFSRSINLAQSNPQKYDAHIALGYLAKQRKDWIKADKHYQAALKSNSSSTVPMWAMADIAQEQANYEIAIDWFNKALKVDTNQSDQGRLAYAHQALGASLYQQKEWTSALEQFQIVSTMQSDNSRTFLYMAFSYKQLGNDAEAVKYMNKALANPEQLTQVELGSLYGELGYLYAGVGQHRDSIKALDKSLNYRDDNEVILNRSSLYRLTGNFDKAQQDLEGLDGKVLTRKLQLNRLNQLALVYAEKEQYVSAVNALLKAESLSSSSEQQYRLATYYRRLDDIEKATHYLEQAVSGKPDNSQYVASLGYLLMNEERYDEAGRLFEGIVKREPSFPQIYQNLGYAQVRNMNNDGAVRWFKQGIDSQASDEQKNLESDDMRREISKITNRYDFSFYQVYRSNISEQGAVSPSLGGGAIPSQGGVNFTYQPPVIGFRDDRVFQLFARVLWNTAPKTLRLNNDSLQGGIGLRYKPLRKHGLFFGIEKLFEIGDNSIDDWLARAQYSWNKKFIGDIKSDDDYYYLSLYGDFGIFRRSSTEQIFSWEAGFGKEIQLGSGLSVSPHLVANGQYQNPDINNGSYAEAGLGISMKYLFGGSQYQADTSSAELRIQYKGEIENYASGWMITGVLQY